MHSSAKSSRGQKGEEQAADALTASGMKIITRNYRAKLPGGIGLGEVDIIALDKETIVFVEVKTWSSFGMENLQYSLDIKKQRKIIKTAKYFMSENRKYNNMAIRFDVIFVKENSITHLASAFTESV